MKLLLARHGETDWNAAKRIQGQADTLLNDKGRAQAVTLASRLQSAGETVAKLYTSPQKRALETAQIAGRALGLEPTPLAALREISFGLWEGHTWEEIDARWPVEYHRYLHDRLHTTPPEGESFQALLERVLPALDAISAEVDGTALVVAHSAVIKAVLCQVTGTPFEQIQTFLMRNADWITLEDGKLLETQTIR